MTRSLYTTFLFTLVLSGCLAGNGMVGDEIDAIGDLDVHLPAEDVTTPDEAESCVANAQLSLEYVGAEWMGLSLEAESFGPLNLRVEATGDSVTIREQVAESFGDFTRPPAASAFHPRAEDVTTGEIVHLDAGESFEGLSRAYTFDSEFTIAEDHETYVVIFVEMDNLSVGDEFGLAYYLDRLDVRDSNNCRLTTSQMQPAGGIITSGMFLMTP